MENKKCDLLIIGGGPAGMTAAIYGARAGLKTIVLEKMGVGGQIMTTAEIENYPGFTSISGPELAMKFNEQAEHCGVEFVYDEIESFDFGQKSDKKTTDEKIAGKKPKGEKSNVTTKTVTCTSTKIDCHAVILCLGASPRKTNAVGEDKFLGSGVHFCALCDGAFYKNKDIVIVGGGNSAVEEVIYMSNIAKSITVVNAAEDFIAQSVLVEKLKTLPNVNAVYHNSTIKQINGDNKIQNVVIDVCQTLPNLLSNHEGKNGCQENCDKARTEKTISCDGVFVAIGRQPSTCQFANIVELDKSGYIVVNDKMQTSVTGIYAAGDCIQKNIRQIITACADGAIAATHSAEYVKSIK